MQTRVLASADRRTKLRHKAIQQSVPSAGEPTAWSENNRSEAVSQRRMQTLITKGPQAVKANAVRAMPNDALQTQRMPRLQRGEIQASFELKPGQREAASVQRQRTDGAADSAGMGVTLANLGAGMRLDRGTATRMAAAFGGECFDDVRIHTGAVARRKVRELEADAMAVGWHIAFAPGEYQPGTPSGDRLIAHELAHVIQQRGCEPFTRRRAARVESGDAPHERDADDVASAVIARLHPGAATNGAYRDWPTTIRPALTSGLGVRRGNKSGKNPHKRAAQPKAAAKAPEGLSEQERQTAIGEACELIEKAAPTLLQARDNRFKNWSPEQIAKDDSMREGVKMALADDKDYSVRNLVYSGICANEALARQEILAEYDRLHPVRKTEAHVNRADPPKLAGHSFRYYDRNYEGKDALIANIIKNGAEYKPASYPRDCVDHVIDEMRDLEPPDQTVAEILAERGPYYRAIIAAFNRRLDQTSNAKGMGTQLGNATGAHYSGVMSFEGIPSHLSD